MCKWLRIGETQSLYRMTAQGKKWWGDPTSPDYDDKNAMEAFGDTLNKRSIENLFSEQDQYILRTLFYPFNARFGYTEANPVRFKKELKEIRPLLDEMLDFEMTLSEKSKLDPATFTQNAVYRLLHASFIDRWSVLNEFGTYPHMLTPLVIG